jgi:hypothetical protein
MMSEANTTQKSPQAEACGLEGRVNSAIDRCYLVPAVAMLWRTWT